MPVDEEVLCVGGEGIVELEEPGARRHRGGGGERAVTGCLFEGGVTGRSHL